MRDGSKHRCRSIEREPGKRIRAFKERTKHAAAIEKNDKKSFGSKGQTREKRASVSEGNRNSKKHLPERFTVHVLLRDATVGERLVPHRVQCVAYSLGFQFISLYIKSRRGHGQHSSKLFHRAADSEQPQREKRSCRLEGHFV